MAASLHSLLDQLDDAVDSTDYAIINEGSLVEVLGKLERQNLTKEALEESRVGKIINFVRQRNKSEHPDIARRCRSLIKLWQSMAGEGAEGTGASASGISPAVRSRLTPNTPGVLSSSNVSRQTTPRSGRSAASRSRSTTPRGPGPSPALRPTGADDNSRGGFLENSYAPATVAPSPAGLKLKIKFDGSGGSPSVSVSQGSSGEAEAQVRHSGQRRKRKLGDPDVTDDDASRDALDLTATTSSNNVTVLTPPDHNSQTNNGHAEAKNKRRKSDAVFSKSKTAPGTLSSVARTPKLKSTAELVADMNRQLPPEMTVDIGDAKPEEEPSRRSKYVEMLEGTAFAEEQARRNEEDPAYDPPVFSLQPDDDDEDASSVEGTATPRGEAPIKRGRGRPKGSKNKVPPSVAALAAATVLTSRLPDEGMSKAKADHVQRFIHEQRPTQAPPEREPSPPPAPLLPEGSEGGEPIDWYARLPPLDAQATTSEVLPPTRNRFLRRLGDGREILGLPYLDIGVPDFVEFHLPDRRSFLSDLNWAYGKKPPEDPAVASPVPTSH